MTFFKQVLHSETLIRWHLINGANPNIPANGGSTPLELAASHSSLTVIKYPIEAGAGIKHCIALHEATSSSGKGRLEIIAYLVNQGADIIALESEVPGRNTLPCAQRYIGTALHRTVKSGRIESVRFLAVRR